MSSNRHRSSQAALWALLAACSAATLTSWIEAPWAALLPVTLLLLAGMYWASRRECAESGPAPLVWLLAAIPAWGAFQLLAGFTVHGGATLKAVAYWSSLAAACALAATSCAGSRDRRRFLTVLGGLASVLGWIALLQPFAGRFGIPFLRSVAADSYAGSFANRNMYACFAELALPVLVWLGLRNGAVHWPWLMNAAALACSVVVSGSRAGALLILAECALCAVVASRGHRLYLKVSLGAALATLVALAAAGEGGFSVRIQYSDPLVHRKAIYQSGLAMLAARPLTGHGLGAFAAAYPAHARFDNGRFVNLAHNDWLQLAVEGGVPVLALLAVFAALLLSRQHRSAIWALGLPVVLLHALVDFPLHRIGVAAWWMALAGAAWPAGRRNDSLPAASAPGGVRISGLKLPTPPRDPPPVPSRAGSSDRSSATVERSPP